MLNGTSKTTIPRNKIWLPRFMVLSVTPMSLAKLSVSALARFIRSSWKTSRPRNRRGSKEQSTLKTLLANKAPSSKLQAYFILAFRSSPTVQSISLLASTTCCSCSTTDSILEESMVMVQPSFHPSLQALKSDELLSTAPAAVLIAAGNCVPSFVVTEGALFDASASQK